MMKKLPLFLLFMLAAIVAKAQEFPSTSWSDVADTAWFNDSQDEFTISTAEELAGISQLVADGTTFEGKIFNIEADIDLDGNLWVPIGAYPDLFSGAVEGNGHVISNLWINTPDTDYAGLFGYTSNSTITNLHIDTANVIGFDSVGTLVANLYDNGSISECSAINITVSGNNNVGGLVGGLVTKSKISGSHAVGDVQGSVQVGGLLGSAWDNCTVQANYSKGTVSAGVLGGGLIGALPFSFTAPTLVSDCYSRASVVINGEKGGGLLGGADNALLLKNSYSTGTVSGGDLKGAAIGFLGGGITVENIYFDTESSGMTEAVGGYGGEPGSPDITGKTTAEMKDPEMVDLLNADTADGPWSIDPEVNDGYPILRQVLGVSDYQNTNVTVTIFPTIVEYEINISSDLGLKSYKVFNYTGSLIAEGDLEGFSSIVTFSSFSSGMYIMTIETEGGSVTKKFIKK